MDYDTIKDRYEKKAQRPCGCVDYYDSSIMSGPYWEPTIFYTSYCEAHKEWSLDYQIAKMIEEAKVEPTKENAA